MTLRIDIQRKHSFSMLVSEDRAPGKITFTKYLLQHKNELISSTP